MIESKVYTCAYINHLQKLIVIRNLLRDTHLWAMLLVELTGRRLSNDIIREKWVSGLAVGGVSGTQAEQKGPKADPLHSLKVGVFHAITGGPGWLAARPSRSLLGRVKSAAHHRWWCL